MSTPLFGATEAQLRRDPHQREVGGLPARCAAPVGGRDGCRPLPRGRRRGVRRPMHRGDTGYGWGPRYAAAVARYAHGAWGWEIDTSAAMIVPDVMIGAAELLRLLTDEGGPVVVSPPVYDSFFGFVDAIGRRRVDAPLGPRRAARPRGPVHRLPGGDRAGRAGGIPAVQPHNPTGVVHTPAELATLAALAEEHGVRVVADEIHAPVVYAGSPCVHAVPHRAGGVSAGSRCSPPRRGGTSPALELALAMAGSAAVDDFAGLAEVHTHGSVALGAIAHVASMADGRQWQDSSGELDANRALLGSLLAEHLPGDFGCWRPRPPTWRGWTAATSVSATTPAATFLRRAGGPRLGPAVRRRGRARVRPAQLRDVAGRPRGSRAADGLGPLSPGLGARGQRAARPRRRPGAPRRRAWRHTARRRARGCGRWR